MSILNLHGGETRDAQIGEVLAVLAPVRYRHLVDMVFSL